MSWTIVGSAGEIAFRIIALMLFSRLLTPRDVGLAAAAIVVLQLAQYVAEMGLVSAVVQVRDLSNEYRRSACSGMLIGGVASAVALWVTAPLIARWIFGLPEISDLIKVLSVTLAIRGATLPVMAFAQRELKFRGIAAIQLLSYAIGFLLFGTIAAMQGWSYWSMIVGFLGQSVIEGIGLLCIGANRIKYGFDRRSAAEMLRFGRSITAAGILNSVAKQVDTIVIGRVIGPSALGVYNRAQRISGFPFGFFDRTAGRVLLPAIARSSEKGTNPLPLIRRVFSVGSFVFVPMAAVLSASGQEVVQLMLGAQWGQAVVPLQVLLCTFFFRFLYKISGTFLTSIGRPSIVVRLQFGFAVGCIVAACALASFGLIAITVGMSAVTIVFGVAAFWRLLEETSITVTELQFEIQALVLMAISSTSLAFSSCHLYRQLFEYGPGVIACSSASTVLGVAAVAFCFPNRFLRSTDIDLAKNTMARVMARWSFTRRMA